LQLHSAAEEYLKEASPESKAVLAAAAAANEEHGRQKAERKALSPTVERELVEVKTIPCKPEQVRVCFKAIMGIADSQATNGQLSTLEAMPPSLLPPLPPAC